MSNVTKLRTRKPTGRPAWPLILLAGGEKTGKTYRAAELSGDPRIASTLWLDLGEGCQDEYGAVPGADYDVIEHNGTWVDIITQVEAAKEYAAAELAAGRITLLVVDSMTAEWAMLTAWTNERAKNSKNNKRLLAQDPDAEIDVSSNYWNDANSRHNRLMNVLKTFPGVVVMTALETEKTQFGPGGRPLENAPKVAKPDGQKRLGADATVWIRLSLAEEPVVVGIRSLKNNITPGKDHPQPWADFTLSKLLFDFLEIGADTAAVRDIPKLDASALSEEERVQDPDGPNGGGGQRPGRQYDRPSHRQPTAEQLAAQAAELAETVKGHAGRLLVVADAGQAAKAMEWIGNQPFMGADVAGHITEEDREVLGLEAGVPITLYGLAEKVSAYTSKHNRSVRMPLDVDRPADQNRAA